MCSVGVGHFIGFKKFASKKIRQIRTGKISFNFHGIFHIDAGKNDSTGKLFQYAMSFLLMFPGVCFSKVRKLFCPEKLCFVHNFYKENSVFLGWKAYN